MYNLHNIIIVMFNYNTQLSIYLGIIRLYTQGHGEKKH